MYPHLLWFLLRTPITIATTATATTAAAAPIHTTNFVTTQNGQFMLNGSKFEFVGTNAYWLSALNTEDDIDNTLGNMSAQGIKVVRTWAFNDVDTIPVAGTWFQLIANGTTSVNLGANGLQKLDTVIRLAEKHGLFVLLTLTNNWNPRPLIDNAAAISPRDVTSGTNNTLPRNTLSNDYGGMDAYVREFGKAKIHDEFYTNSTVLGMFLNYTTQVISRYVNNSTIFGWEIANDSRCNSTLPASITCSTTIITNFHSVVSQHISAIDPHHLITSGTQGFFCAQCPKLFPQLSPNPTQPRDDLGTGSAYDGSLGVDSEDILNIPQIAFGTFQLFPDQYDYGINDPFLQIFDSVLNNGLGWIGKQTSTGKLFGKPMVLNGFGLVTQNNAPFFVPFNETQAPFASNRQANQTLKLPFVDDDQRDEAYSQWIDAALGLQAILQYQWTQGNLTVAAGTIIPTAAAEGASMGTIFPGTGISPNDGYSNAPSDSLASVFNSPKRQVKAKFRLSVVIGSLAGGAVVVAALIFFFVRRRRANLVKKSDATAVEPFSRYPPFQQNHKRTITQREKIQRTDAPGILSHQPAEVVVPLERPRQFRLNFHEDSGTHIPQPEEETSIVVIEMPPTYTSVEAHTAAALSAVSMAPLATR